MVKRLPSGDCQLIELVISNCQFPPVDFGLALLEFLKDGSFATKV